jgi:2-oxoglutarate dehydrogenase E1 component
MWVQDEPANQGAWPYIAMNLPQALADRGETRPLQVASRLPSASPATGSSKKHALQQAQLIAKAFTR